LFNNQDSYPEESLQPDIVNLYTLDCESPFHPNVAGPRALQPCKIAFDLADPKLRTGPVSPSPGIIRWKPERNELGQVMTAAYVTFHTGSYSSEGETIPIPVKGSLFRHVQAGNIVELIDTRGRERTLHVVEVEGPSCLCTNDRTGYVVQGSKLRLLRGKELLCEDEVGIPPEVEDCLSLSAGDDLI
jgi:pyruvate kinase